MSDMHLGRGQMETSFIRTLRDDGLRRSIVPTSANSEPSPKRAS
jgi:hypothetical protein